MDIRIELDGEGKEVIDSFSHTQCREGIRIELQVGDVCIDGITKDQASEIIGTLAHHMGKGYRIKID